MIPEWADKTMSERLPQLRAQGEGQTLEFKRELEEGTDQLKKEIAAFATSNPGLILIGVGDDGALVGLTGMETPDARDELRRKVEGRARAVKPAVTPSITFAVEQGKVVLAIEVTGCTQPVYYSNNIPYVRHVTQVHSAEPHEVIDQVKAWLQQNGGTVGDDAEAKRHADIERALGYLAEADTHQIINTLPVIISKPRLVLSIAPIAAHPGRPLRAPDVQQAQLKFPPSVNARVKEGCTGQQWWSAEPPQAVPHGPNPESTWLMRLVRPGVLQYFSTIGHRVDNDPEILVNGYELEGRIIFGLQRMALILNDLGLSGAAVASVQLQGVVDVVLTRSTPGDRRVGQHDLYLNPIFIPDLSVPFADLYQESFDVLWQTAGWADGSPSFRSGQWAGYTNECLYGDWAR